jgi:hypothetical protein
VPEADVRRRFERSRRQWLEDYLPLAMNGGMRQSETTVQIANSQTHTVEQLHTMLDSKTVQEVPPGEISKMSKIVLEASRVATEKMLDYYRRMDIEVTPEMTLAPEKPANV